MRIENDATWAWEVSAVLRGSEGRALNDEARQCGEQS